MPEQNKRQKKLSFKRELPRRELPKPKEGPLSRAFDEAFKNAGQIYLEASLKGSDLFPPKL